MKKASGIFAVILIGIMSIGLVAAYGLGIGGPADGTAKGEPGLHHEEMEEIIEEGTFEDLVSYREETGLNVMPWVENEEDFELAKEMHDKMEAWHEENGYARGAGMGAMMRGSGVSGRGTGYQRSGSCPMTD